MKVYIPDRPANTGKGKFIQRLIPALQKAGVEITHKPKADIYFDTGRFHEKPKCRKWVLRLGPAHVDINQNYKKLNKPKWKSAKRAHGIIYQSKYSRKVCRKFLGKPKGMETIIHNGADPDFYIDLKKMPSPFRYNFCAVTRKWIPQKRLKDIIKSFLLANVPDSALYIAGEAFGMNKKYGQKNVIFLGSLDDRRLGRLYRLCNAMIHIVYLDACPNSVIEALMAGCHVITTNQGGTHELVEGHGLVIPDKQYRFKPVDLNKPPKINREFLADRIQMICEKDIQRRSAIRFHIYNIACQYKNFFWKVLND